MPLRRLALDWGLPAGLACMVVAFAAGSSSEPWVKRAGHDARWIVLVGLCGAAVLVAGRRLWIAKTMPRRGLVRFGALAASLLALAVVSTAWSVTPRLSFERAASLGILFVFAAALASATADDAGARVRLFQGLAAGAIAVGLLGIVVLVFDYNTAVRQLQPPAPGFSSKVAAAPPQPSTKPSTGSTNGTTVAPKPHEHTAPKPRGRGNRQRTTPKGPKPILVLHAKTQQLPPEQYEIGYPSLSKTATTTLASGRVAAWERRRDVLPRIPGSVTPPTVGKARVKQRPSHDREDESEQRRVTSPNSGNAISSAMTTASINADCMGTVAHARATVRLGRSVCLGPSPAWCPGVACDSSGDWPRACLGNDPSARTSPSLSHFPHFATGEADRRTWDKQSRLLRRVSADLGLHDLRVRVLTAIFRRRNSNRSQPRTSIFSPLTVVPARCHSEQPWLPVTQGAMKIGIAVHGRMCRPDASGE